MPITTRATAPSAWRRPMSCQMTKTVSECVFLETETPTLNLKFRKEQWCEPAATRQFFTKATWQTAPKSTLLLVKRYHLKKGPIGAYISDWTTMMILLHKTGTHRRLTNFRQLVPHRKSLTKAYSI